MSVERVVLAMEKKESPPPVPGVQPALGLVGLGAIVATYLGLKFGVHPFVTHTYEIAWWATILVLDGAVWWIRGRSLLFASPALVLVLSLWSVVLWFLFELANLRLENWYYVNVGSSWASRWTGSFLSYATVLPALLLLAEVFGAEFTSGRATDPGGVESPSSKRSLPAVALPLCLVFGVVSLALPLLWPRYFYPLIWGSLFFFLEPLNYRAGAFSFLREWQSARYRALIGFLLAGLLCGLWWEFWNHDARVKWIYTVPFFEEWKLFEMPFLGFLGFPPFALECAAFMATLERYGLLPGRGDRKGPQTFAKDSDRRRSRSPHEAASVSPAACHPIMRASVKIPFGVAVLSAAVVAGISLPLMDRFTFASTYPFLEDYQEIDSTLRNKLNTSGIRDGFDLFEKAQNGDSELVPLKDFIELSILRGIGVEKARALQGCGVRSVAQLARKDWRELWRSLQSQHTRSRLSVGEVRVWIRAARRRR